MSKEALLIRLGGLREKLQAEPQNHYDIAKTYRSTITYIENKEYVKKKEQSLSRGISGIYLGAENGKREADSRLRNLTLALNDTIADLELNIVKVKTNVTAQPASYTIQGNNYGQVGSNISGTINIHFEPIQRACEEAKLSVDEISQLKVLFEKKDSKGLVEKITEFGIHTAAIIAGHALLHLSKLQ